MPKAKEVPASRVVVATGTSPGITGVLVSASRALAKEGSAKEEMRDVVARYIYDFDNPEDLGWWAWEDISPENQATYYENADELLALLRDKELI